MMLKRLQLGFGRGKRPGDAQLSPVGSTVSGSTVRDGAEKKSKKVSKERKIVLTRRLFSCIITALPRSSTERV